MEKQGEIILYQPDEAVKLEVRLEDETVWLNRQQLSELFDRDIKTIGKHISNALKEELIDIPTVAKFATVQKEGERFVTRQVEFYNLDMILSVGYRVKSQRRYLPPEAMRCARKSRFSCHVPQWFSLSGKTCYPFSAQSHSTVD